MTCLEKIIISLENNINNIRENYKIPYCWNYVNADFEKSDSKGEITVNSVDYFLKCLKEIENTKGCDFSDDIIMYSMLVRTFSAWDHGNGYECGTFLKSICLLPLLKETGVNTIYLLPVFEMSQMNKKGEIPSPYAIKNIMKIDNSLKDDHLPDISPEEEFKAFCEACHKLGIRVILDFVFRTVSRDSVLLEEHPEWFYYIKSHEADNFNAPGCSGIGHSSVNEKSVKNLYNSSETESFANCFVYPPDKKTMDFLKQNDEREINEIINDKLGITVMPGFADTINDPQPQWSDVTFLKFYFDNTVNVKNKFGEKFPPMIAQDGVKCSLFGGDEENKDLWEYTENIIPYYIKNYSLDGARIDMAHALPEKLNQRIISKVKSIKKDFIFSSEDFDSSKTAQLKETGYDFFTGGIWDAWGKKEYKSKDFNKKIYESVSGEIPCVSCLEMADTPRIAHLLGQKQIISSIIISSLLPNTVYLINNGMEFSEKQPMNLGLNNNEDGKYVLPKNHPYYGKLAFFDNFLFDWTNRKHIFTALKEGISLRTEFYEIIKDKNNFDMKLLKNSSLMTTVSAFNGEYGFLALFNRGDEEIKIYTKKIIPKNSVISECVFGCENKNILYPDSVIVYKLEKNNTKC